MQEREECSSSSIRAGHKSKRDASKNGHTTAIESQIESMLQCRADETEQCRAGTPFEPFRDDDDGSEFQRGGLMYSSTSCTCRGGQWSSSQHVTRIQFTASGTQRFIKYLLPIVFICLINMVTYLMKQDEYKERVRTFCFAACVCLFVLEFLLVVVVY